MEQAARALALFDFDGTLIKGDSIVAYLRLARRMKALGRWEYLAVLAHTVRFLLGRESAQAAKQRALRFRMQLDPLRREALDRAFAQECLLPRIFPQGLRCLRGHQAAGRQVVLVSASPENYMRYVAQGLDAALICTPVSENGDVGENCSGEEKVRRLVAWAAQENATLDADASYAYGDSGSDLPLLRLCGHSVQVNPKRKLRKAAPGMERQIWKK